MMKKMKRLVVALLGVVIGVAGYSVARTPADTLVVALTHASLSDFEPAAIYNFEAGLLAEQVYETLIRYWGGETEVFEPGLATSWERSSDGFTWTFTIRQGVLFHSGNVVNADAVVFSLQRTILHDRAPGKWILTQFIPTPDMVRKVDEYTVEITTSEPIGESLMLSILTYHGPGSILDAALVQQHATADDPYGSRWLATNDAGSGPYVLSEWNPGERIVLEAFPQYWKGEPPTKYIMILDVPEPTAQKLALERGDVDIAMGLLPEMINDLRDNANISIMARPAFELAYVAMNVTFEPFSDMRVRQAVRYAIDYQAIAQGVLGGAAVENQVILPHGMPERLDLGYPHDPDRARQLLRDAGYEDGFDVELIVRTTPPFPDLAVQVQENLRQVGINARVVSMQNVTNLALFREQNFELTIMRWGLDYPAAQGQARAFSDCLTSGPEAPVQSIAWRTMWCPSGLTDLVREATAELDQQRSETLYREIQAVTLEEGPYAILYNPITQIALRSNVTGLHVPPMWPFMDFSLVMKN